MRHRWPKTPDSRVWFWKWKTTFVLLWAALHICDHRRHRIFTLQGPVE